MSTESNEITVAVRSTPPTPTICTSVPSAPEYYSAPMALRAGEKLGPYQIVAPIGAGGMGEVYRASDPRLGRDVAIKVISAGFAADPERLHRFEVEARAAAALNHPNILAVHDIGTRDGIPYIVSELLDGQTLGRLLAGGALSHRKAIDYGTQVCRGLAAAHNRGIVHRDLKPDNVFVTADGRIKILDFGLAKLTESTAGAAAASMLPTKVQDTAPGVVLGTFGYMSPEQVRGQAVDHRSDIFSFGAMLFEMLSGERAFGGDTAADTMSAVLNNDPLASARWHAGVHPLLDETVRHCLEKNPADRFQSASDVAFTLAASGASSSVSSAAASAVVPVAGRGKRSKIVAAIVGTAIAALAIIGWLNRAALVRAVTPAPPSFRQLTFRRGVVEGAAFAPDGQTIVYAAAWEGQPLTVYSTRLDSPESRELGITNADVVGTTAAGDLFVRLGVVRRPPFLIEGTLARASIAGAAPRPLVDNVVGASPGSQMAVVRRVDRRYQLEFPIGHVIHQSPVWISEPRVAPDGSSVAVIVHHSGAIEGQIALFDTAGHKRMLSTGWPIMQGIAWSPSGREVWFTTGSSTAFSRRQIHAIDLAGHERLVYVSPTDMQLQDIARDGRVLVATVNRRAEVRGLLDGEREERTLSAFDWATGPKLSPDGRSAVFDESGDAMTDLTHGASYLIRTGETAPTRVAEGPWIGPMSPDGRLLCALSDKLETVEVVPIGPGQPRKLPSAGITTYTTIPEWMPDSKRVLFTGIRGNDDTPHTYVQSIDGGGPDALPVTGARLSHDGRRLILAGEGPLTVYDLDSRQRIVLPATDDLSVVGWSPDSTAVYAAPREQRSLPLPVYAIDIASGRRRDLMRFAPADRTGITAYSVSDVVKDGAAYVLSVVRTQSDLHVISGLR
jgi:Tol biopolymer transport system component